MLRMDGQTPAWGPREKRNRTLDDPCSSTFPLVDHIVKAGKRHPAE